MDKDQAEKDRWNNQCPHLGSALEDYPEAFTYFEDLHPSDPVLPVLSNQKMNAYLKEIADLAGITKELSYHIARHTFATTVTMLNGVPIESVSRMLGHKNIKSTQHYARIIDQKVSSDMKDLASRIDGKMAVNWDKQNARRFRLRAKNIMEEYKFRIKAYGFGELAQMYLPDATPMSASNRLQIWITRNKTLMEKLQSIGYLKGAKLLTPEMVKEIVLVIGEP